MSSINEELVEFVRQRDWVTFVEVVRFLESKGIPTEGPYSYELRENIVVWMGSKEMMDIVYDLLNMDRLYLHPASLLVYMMDGGYFNMPLVKSSRQYKTPHWAPCFLRVFPMK